MPCCSSLNLNILVRYFFGLHQWKSVSHPANYLWNQLFILSFLAPSKFPLSPPFLPCSLLPYPNFSLPFPTSPKPPEMELIPHHGILQNIGNNNNHPKVVTRSIDPPGSLAFRWILSQSIPKHPSHSSEVFLIQSLGQRVLVG